MQFAISAGLQTTGIQEEQTQIREIIGERTGSIVSLAIPADIHGNMAKQIAHIYGLHSLADVPNTPLGAIVVCA